VTSADGPLARVVFDDIWNNHYQNARWSQTTIAFVFRRLLVSPQFVRNREIKPTTFDFWQNLSLHVVCDWARFTRCFGCSNGPLLRRLPLPLLSAIRGIIHAQWLLSCVCDKMWLSNSGGDSCRGPGDALCQHRTYSAFVDIDKFSARSYMSPRNPIPVPANNVFSIQSFHCFPGFIHLFFNIHDVCCKSPNIAPILNAQSSIHNLKLAIIAA
jgi:hypothetical protein